MTSRTRYETKIEDGTLYIEHLEDGWLKIGSVDGIVDLLGGETYTLQYTEEQATVAWLDTDDDGTLTIDIRETLKTMSYDEEFVTTLTNSPVDEAREEKYPKRAELFADLLREILESKGNMNR